MMKIARCIGICLLFLACSEKAKQTSTNIAEDNMPAQYDTVAIDSFSAGAVSVDVVERIRRSSQRYQDSMKIVREKEAAELLRQERERREKEASE